ncbi:MAG: glyceraldehyde-3-phosphate dehydrogenase [Candidatus Diapherotrites archaeon ADurb.Bin253]|mgnify:FL=1|nr:MAG: glyceraldehyde-3-phosphate dehydrogenase [Candidatus Diapherotrites archaeon ADurb.Bin253]HNZ51935.1 type I glyceraldehyde-3-phosphate dehydrogenase [Candidatus Pacearchaeota archaeon]HOC96885.1 type I glyceraldehyde-3-phosphate dehydrogenase [Candidatus Pacearchaeota archaeon]HOF43862.1 type I glyceraldehyde-3-phosphate dehydrogenase [Candidatus Pacearchaeota archaeon]HOH04015.1 type I glyceraldehyde-3-phosphate dehydrogenase [Candidatus Pacearchaeota archaeon]
MVKVAINGLGRIGRSFLKIALDKGINVVAVNDLASIDSIVYLMKYDSVYGNYKGIIEKGNGFIKLNRKKIMVFSEKQPENLPWAELGVDIVVECTGAFTDREGAMKHLWAGAKKVLISAPAKEPDITVVLGVNEKELKKEHKIISMASCTTNCLAPVVKVLNDNFKIQSGYMTTVHAYTNDQEILDIPHKKFRRGRAGAINLVPTSSGASSSVGEVIPELRGKLDGLAIRAPVPCGSITDFVAVVGRAVTREEVNAALKNAAEKQMKGVLQYSEDELVSSDIIKNPNSSIVDSLLTQTNGNFVKVLSWYDNEWGYSNRLVEMIKLLK